MSFHKELFKDLPPADEIGRSFEGMKESVRNADGFYALVQDIAAKYGDKAYELAESVFQETGMKYDSADLRTPGKIRRVGYGFDGGNIYDVQVKPFEPAMLKGVVRCYRNIYRQLSPDMLITEADYQNRVLADPKACAEGLLVASNPNGMTLGFVHCCVDTARNSGTVEAFAFYPGRMHQHVAPALVAHAASFFAGKGIKNVGVFGGRLHYPFYRLGGKLRAQMASRASYLHDAIADGATQSGWKWS